MHNIYVKYNLRAWSVGFMYFPLFVVFIERRPILTVCCYTAASKRMNLKLSRRRFSCLMNLYIKIKEITYSCFVILRLNPESDPICFNSFDIKTATLPLPAPCLAYMPACNNTTACICNSVVCQTSLPFPFHAQSQIFKKKKFSTDIYERHKIK